MKHFKLLSFLSISLIFLSCSSCSSSDDTNKKEEPTEEPTITKKEVKIPLKTLKENKFNEPNSNFSDKYSAQSDNIVIFWDKSFGLDPEKYSDKSRRFSPKEILEEGEKIYNFYTDKLAFADRKTSIASKYKMILWMYNDDNSTAYGWGEEGIGMMWFRPSRIQGHPYCALGHEMGHSFQCIIEADGGRGYSGTPLPEFTSQWMIWQYFPDWTTIEKYHLDAYMNNTHYSILHSENMYHAPQFMEYWSTKHGQSIIAKLWSGVKGNENIIAAYQRITNITQEEFNNEIYDAATKYITWDLPRIREYCIPYRNQHKSKLFKTNDEWYQIDESKTPQSYGYNAIRLNTPAAGETISINFKGIASNKQVQNNIKVTPEWRYGFVAVNKNGDAYYGDMNKAINELNKSVDFTVTGDIEYLWLVVTGAPAEHDNIQLNSSEQKNAEKNPVTFPYQIKIKGTSPHSSVL